MCGVCGVYEKGVWRVCGVCEEGVWRAGVWSVSRGCVEGVCGGCVEGVWRV